MTVKTKHQSQLITTVDMTVSLSTTVPRISDIVRRKQAHKSLTGWLTGLKLFLIFQ